MGGLCKLMVVFQIHAVHFHDWKDQTDIAGPSAKDIPTLSASQGLYQAQIRPCSESYALATSQEASFLGLHVSSVGALRQVAQMGVASKERAPPLDEQIPFGFGPDECDVDIELRVGRLAACSGLRLKPDSAFPTACLPHAVVAFF